MQKAVRNKRKARKVMEKNSLEEMVVAYPPSEQPKPAVRKVRNLTVDELYNELNNCSQLAPPPNMELCQQEAKRREDRVNMTFIKEAGDRLLLTGHTVDNQW